MKPRLPTDPTAYLQGLLHAFSDLDRGKVAPHEKQQGGDPERFAIALATVDGELWSVGDDGHAFALQSMSKPFIYGLALDRLGRDKVLRKVSVEPTGEAFNSIIELEEDHLPYNPMINSGAIAISALLHHADRAHAGGQIMEMFGAYLGREAKLLEPVADPDLDTSHRNKAIAHLLRHFEVIGEDIDGALQLYAAQCLVTATTPELALMAATLANEGVQPRTGQRAIERQHLRDVLTLMLTCGMYDSSGAWAYHVGLPAKSGVSGGILAVVPGRMGLAVYSPRLDAHGHSVRGVEVFRQWSADWGLSLFER